MVPGQQALRIGLGVFVSLALALPAAAGDIVAFSGGPSGIQSGATGVLSCVVSSAHKKH